MEYDVITGRPREIKKQLNDLKVDYIIEVLGMCSHKTDICMAISKREFKLVTSQEISKREFKLVTSQEKGI